MVPAEIRTPRLLLRRWNASDAEQLHPILVANYEHLAPWIPARIATPAVIPLLAERLAAFAGEFDSDREWRFAVLTADEQILLGEIDLFPRDAAGRVAAPDADRAEIGYWIRFDHTGRGFVTEAAQAIVDAARRVGRFTHLEIRCDARNASSAAVPKRLGFELTTTIETPGVQPQEADVQLQIWTFRTV